MNADYIKELQEKYNIADTDPIMAVLELFQEAIITEPMVSITKIASMPSFLEFREAMEHLDELSKSLSNTSQNLLQEIRKETQPKKSSNIAAFFIQVILAIFTTGAGFIIGKFIL